MMNDREDYEDFEPIGILDDLIQTRRKRFIEGCEEGYELLRVNGQECLNVVPESEAREALRRMLGHFEQTEEFEKCTLIAEVYRDRYKEKITPIILEDIYGQS
jgi:hypothetical protein